MSMIEDKGKSLVAGWFTNPVNWIKGGAYALLLGSVYYSTLTWLIGSDWAREDYSYCYLIPFVVLYLVWDKKDRLADLPSIPSWKGLIPLGLGLVFFWLGDLGGEFLALYISFWLVLLGLCWLHLGWEKIKELSFPFIIMLTMFPLPHFLYNKVSLNLKLISSQLGVDMMQLYGMSAYREGNVIDLGFTQLQVVDACSGLRFLIPLIVLGLLLAYFFRAHFWKRAVLVISTVPLAVVTNSLRIALTGILYEGWGAKVAEGFFHGFSGWFIFMFSLAVLLLEMWILKKLPPAEVKSRAGGDQGAPGQERPFVSGAPVQRPGLPAVLKPPQFIAALILLGITLVLSQGVEFREKIPITRPLDQFPLKIGEWTGASRAMEQKFIDTLDLSNYVIIDYKNKPGRQVNFYAAYYESQRKGESIHSPATCLPGGGWLFKQAGAVTISAPGHGKGSMKVNRAYMQKGEHRQLSYYWFDQRGRVLTSAYQLKIFVFLDALTKQRTDGALVRLITPVYEDEKLKDAEERLQSFTRQLAPVLAEFIPGSEVD